MFRKLGRKKIAVIALVVIGLAAGMVLVGLKLKKSVLPIPENITNAVTFPLYFPADLPKKVDFPGPEAFSAQNQVVTYYFNYDGKHISVSEQPRPLSFDFNKFNFQQIAGSKEIVTRSGKAVAGSLGGITTVSLVTDKTWVLVRGDSDIPAATIEQLTENMVVQPTR